MDAPFLKRAKPCKRERSTRLGAFRLPGIDAGQSLRFLALQNEDISKEAQRVREAIVAAAGAQRLVGTIFLTSPTGLAGPAVDNSHRGAGSKRNHRGRMVAPAALAEPLAASAAAAPRVAFRGVW